MAIPITIAITRCMVILVDRTTHIVMSFPITIIMPIQLQTGAGCIFEYRPVVAFVAGGLG